MAEMALALRDFASEQLGTGSSPDPAADILFAGWTHFYGLDQAGRTTLPKEFSGPSNRMLSQLFDYENKGRWTPSDRFRNSWYSSVSTKIPPGMTLKDFQSKFGEFLRRRAVGYVEKTAADRNAIEERFLSRKRGWFSKRRLHFDLAKKMGFDIKARESELMAIEDRLEKLLSQSPETLLSIIATKYRSVEAELASAGISNGVVIRDSYETDHVSVWIAAEHKEAAKKFARNFILDELRLGSESLIQLLRTDKTWGNTDASHNAWEQYYDAFQQFLLDYSIDLTPVSSAQGVFFKTDPTSPNTLWVFGYSHESQSPEEFLRQKFTKAVISNVKVLQEMEKSDYAYPLVFTAKLTLP